MPKNTVRLYTQNSPFDDKDRLKAGGYSWFSGDTGGRRGWFIDVPVLRHIQKAQRRLDRWETRIQTRGTAPTRVLVNFLNASEP